MWTRLTDWWSDFDVWNAPLFTIGGTPVTLLHLLTLIALSIALVIIAARVQSLLARRVLARTHLDASTREFVASIVRYIVLVVGFLIIVQAIGINLTTLNVLAGAVGVGIGFGTQNIIQNWVSGLIVMFERPIRIGDRIQVAGIEGDVTEIGARRTTIVGNDNRAVIVPNSKLITDVVVNWQYYCQEVTLRLEVAVAPGSDVRVAEQLLRDIAKQNQDLLAQPAAIVNLMTITGGALKFELIVWTRRADMTSAIVSRLNFAILEQFSRHDIKIA
ncbi:MAG TPA: mechanosensitive ion channel domain-containing protein [Casimicrobiaceae bacterium]|nr:mechanosensitive ion channel domain-containing protein [Casimicrobiaceae bacterium]